MSLHVDNSKGYPNHRRMCWDEENRMILSADEEQMAGYVYDAGGMRTQKASGTVVYSTVNGYPNSFATVSAFTLYPSELITVSSGMYTKHYYNGSSRIASRIGGGFNRHNDLNNYRPLTDHVRLQNGNDYTNKAQQFRDRWSHNASCAGLDQNLEYAYSLELNPLFANPQPDGARYFYHSDHLGSSAYITTENGYATQFLAYMPFGETLSEQQNSTSYYSPFKFSAKEKDPEMRSIREDHWKTTWTEQTGYSYFGARYYSPELSVWLGIDPLADKAPGWTPYRYGFNNPTRFIDPTGMIETDPDGDPEKKLDITPKCPSPQQPAPSPIEVPKVDGQLTPIYKKPGEELSELNTGLGALGTVFGASELYLKANSRSNFNYTRFNGSNSSIRAGQLSNTFATLGKFTFVGSSIIDLSLGALGYQSFSKSFLNIGVGGAAMALGGIPGLTLGLGYTLLDQTGILAGPSTRISLPPTLMALPDATYLSPTFSLK